MLTYVSLKDNKLSKVASQNIDKNSWLDYATVKGEEESLTQENIDIDRQLKSLDMAINFYGKIAEKEVVTQEDITALNYILKTGYESIGISQEDITTDNLLVAEENILDGIKTIFVKVFEFIKKVFEWIGKLIGKFIDWVSNLFSKSSSSGTGGGSIAQVTSRLNEEEFKKELISALEKHSFNFSERTLLALGLFNSELLNKLQKDEITLTEVLGTKNDNIFQEPIDFLNKNAEHAKERISNVIKDIKDTITCEDIKRLGKELDSKSIKQTVADLGKILDLDVKKIKIFKDSGNKKYLYVKIDIELSKTNNLNVTFNFKILTGTKESIGKFLNCNINDKKDTNVFLNVINNDISKNLGIINKNIVIKITENDLDALDALGAIDDKLKATNKKNIETLLKELKEIREKINIATSKIDSLKSITVNTDKGTIVEDAKTNYTKKIITFYKEYLYSPVAESLNIITLGQRILFLNKQYDKDITKLKNEIIKISKSIAKKS